MDTSEVNKKYDHENSFTSDDIIKALGEEQGCRLTGSFSVMRLTGNFHVASHTFAPFIKKFREKGQNIYFNITQTIHRMSFEGEKDINLIREKFNECIITPMDGFFLVEYTQGSL